MTEGAKIFHLSQMRAALRAHKDRCCSHGVPRENCTVHRNESTDSTEPEPEETA